MPLRDWLAAYRHRKAAAYVRRHRDLAVTALRTDRDFAVQVAREAWEQLTAAQDPQRRTLEYPVLSQLGTGGRVPVAQTLPKSTPFNLRRFSEYPPARRGINALTNPLLDLPWTIEPIPPVFGDAPDTPPAEQQRRIEAFTRCLRQPNPDDSWRSWLEPVAEDLIVGGYGASEVARTGDPEQPLRLWPVDGQSIRLNVRWDGDPAAWRYTQSLGYVGLSVGTQATVALRDDELLYLKLNPRTCTPFGLGYLEVAFQAINAFLGAFDYAEKRASNATPNFALFLGENIDLATAKQWQAYWQNQIEGSGAVPILGGGRAPEVLRFAQDGTGDQLFLHWQEFLLRVIAMAFGLSPQKFGLERDVNRATAETQDTADWDTVSPVATAISDRLTHKLLHQQLGWTDLQFRWIPRDTDELRQAQVLAQQYEMNALTVNEIRQVYGRAPLPDLGDLTRTGFEARAAAQALPALPQVGGPPGLEEEDDLPDHDEPEADAD